MRKRITEYLEVDVTEEIWVCHKCDYELYSAHDTYKKGCLLYERDLAEIHRPQVEEEYTFAPDKDWVRLIEYYCPGCGTLIETELLPPGHPITNDIELDLEDLRKKLLEEQAVVEKEQ